MWRLQSERKTARTCGLSLPDSVRCPGLVRLVLCVISYSYLSTTLLSTLPAELLPNTISIAEVKYGCKRKVSVSEKFVVGL